MVLAGSPTPRVEDIAISNYILTDRRVSGTLTLVEILLLGDLTVPPGASKLRSRTEKRLVGFLALSLGRRVSKDEVEQIFWPDSDFEQQSQNLRKAISDIRRVLGGESVLATEGRQLWLDPEQVSTDVSQFRSLTNAGLAGNDIQANLSAALKLYRGPLMATEDDSWILVHRMELEERFCQAAVHLIGKLLGSGNSAEAIRVGSDALLVAPLREDLHIALMQAYSSAGLNGEAIGQYEALEALLSSEWGETPSPKSAAAFAALSAQSDPPSSFSRGTIPSLSSFYILRSCDVVLERALAGPAETLLIHGPRQVGKTTLLGRMLSEVRATSSRAAMIDFQMFNRSQLACAEDFYRVLAHGLAAQLGVRMNPAERWNDWLGPNSNLHALVGQILEQVDGPVVWAMDEADRLFGMELADDFYGLVRSWHNLRATDGDGPFGRLTIVISYATEAQLFIQDLNQSPFNVGVRIPVRDFDLTETAELMRRYGCNDREAETLRRITGGQPFLTRRALDAIQHDGLSLSQLESSAADTDGPFGEHLRRLLFVIQRDEHTLEEVIRYLRGEPFTDAKTPLRLVAGGMLIRRDAGQLDVRIPSYRDFLVRHLLESV